MARPNAPTEGGNAKILFLMYDNSGTNAAAILRSVVQKTMNSETVGYMGVGTAGDATTFAAGDPVLTAAGVEGTTVRKILVDASGRQILVGAAADGAPVAGNPVLIAGGDGTNAQTLLADTTGRIVTADKAATATLSNVSLSTSSVTLLASNTARLGATIFNDADQPVFVKFGSTASSTSFTHKIAVDTGWQVPFGYTGIITGIWASGSGAARVTEITA